MAYEKDEVTRKIIDWCKANLGYEPDDFESESIATDICNRHYQIMIRRVGSELIKITMQKDGGFVIARDRQAFKLTVKAGKETIDPF